MCDTPYLKQITEPTVRTIALPCGKCLPCKQKTKAEWLFRLEQDLKDAISAHFVTLTYNDKYLPISYQGFPTLNYQDVQLYIKRLRKQNNKKPKISLFTVGEYGTIKHRPHYHIIMFNASAETIEPNWSILNITTQKKEEIGRVDIGTVTSASIMYCLNYIDKGDNKPTGWEDSEDEFRIMSKGIGNSYYKSHLKQYKNNLIDHVALQNGTPISIPRYYINKIMCPMARQSRGIRLSNEYNEKLDKEIAQIERNGEDYYDLLSNSRLARQKIYERNKKTIRQ